MLQRECPTKDCPAKPRWLRGNAMSAKGVQFLRDTRTLAPLLQAVNIAHSVGEFYRLHFRSNWRARQYLKERAECMAGAGFHMRAMIYKAAAQSLLHRQMRRIARRAWQRQIGREITP